MSETSWHSYPKVYALGHKAIRALLDGPVLVEEKIDGSQFSFGLIDGELKVKTRKKEMVLDAPEKMFQKAIDAVVGRDLRPGWTYRAEYLQKPRHNVLAYDRIPQNNLIIFDINDGHESYLPYTAKFEEAKRLGFECVPAILEDVRLEEPAELRDLLERTSVLGGQKIEGVVVKRYDAFGLDGKVMLGKFVSESFKEVHQKDWKQRNPSGKDIVSILISKYKTQARWNKAIQHLRERGGLLDAPQDIGQLLIEIEKDTCEECYDDIMKALGKWAWPQIARGIKAGFPEYYKELLLEKQFEGEADGSSNDSSNDS